MIAKIRTIMMWRHISKDLKVKALRRNLNISKYKHKMHNNKRLDKLAKLINRIISIC